MQKSDLKKINLPDVPGVYVFKQGRKVLYVGKATSLCNRVRSYFDNDLIVTRGPRVVDMVTKADHVIYEPTPTVLEALVREAVLIKKYNPIANSEGKDDKTFLYTVITKEDIPRVLVMRGKDIDFETRKTRLNIVNPNSRFNIVFRAIYGPFPSGAQLKEALRIIRRIFPFFDTPKPIGEGGSHHLARIEFNTQIKRYPREFNKREYQRNIRHVMSLLSGHWKEVRIIIEKEMQIAAKEERFEDASHIRQQLFALNHIQDVSLIKDENTYPLKHTVVDNNGYRIEAYDIAHLSGTNAIGVMTVLKDGSPAKKEYRTFRIRGNVGHPTSHMSHMKNNDIASLKEILSRRLNHTEWQFPDAIVVDGGKAQKKAAEEVISERLSLSPNEIPVVAVVKDERHRPREVIGARAGGISESDAVLANAEAHRFSLVRHRRARSRNLRTS